VGDRERKVMATPALGDEDRAGSQNGQDGPNSQDSPNSRPIRGAVRAVGLDLGSRRIGVAVSDSAGTLASPRTTVLRTKDVAADHRALVSLVVEAEAGVVVIGLPLSLRGDKGAAAKAAEAEAATLVELLEPEGVEVELFDERLTTVSAHAALAETGKSSRQRRSVVDQSAAAVLLQAWLDGRRSSGRDR
jgi:putative Holliday junction resolvase